MRALIGALVILFGSLQYELWFDPNGIGQVVALNRTLTQVTAENKTLSDRNQLLQADVTDLKQGQEAVETRARNDFGMIKQGEVFYQIVS